MQDPPAPGAEVAAGASRPARVSDLGELAFAAIGVFVLAGLVFPLQTLLMVASSADPDPAQMARYGLVDAAVRLPFGIGLVLARRPLARWLASDAKLPGLGRHDLLPLVLAAVGAWLALRGAAASAQQLAYGAPWTKLAGAATLFALGAALFLGARGVAGLWRHLREAR